MGGGWVPAFAGTREGRAVREPPLRVGRGVERSFATLSMTGRVGTARARGGDESPHSRGQEGVLEGLLRQRDSSTPLCYVQNDMLVEMPERCRRFLGRRAGLKPASTGRGGRGGGMGPRIREDTGRGRGGNGIPRLRFATFRMTCVGGDGAPHPRGQRGGVGGRPGGTALRGTGEGMGPRMREDNGRDGRFANRPNGLIASGGWGGF